MNGVNKTICLSSQDNLFSLYIKQRGVFKNKDILSSSFIPDKIAHRNNEIRQLSLILAPLLKGFQANNVFIYGKCGTGKTVCSKYVLTQLLRVSEENNLNIKAVYVNCRMKKVSDTEYRLLATLLKEFGEDVPDTGLPTDSLYKRFFDKLESEKLKLILVLDEIDTLYRKIGDEFLYNLTRINTELKNSYVVTVGITNDLSFKDQLDLRVRSSLSEEEIIFKPYDAVQLKDILTERCKEGFYEDAISDAIIAKCAALAAQEHGDARRALDLLRIAGEIAERNGETIVREEHVDMAEEKIDIDRTTEVVKNQPKHSQLVLYTIIQMMKRRNEVKNNAWMDTRLLTGEVFEEYRRLCAEIGIKPLTQRRVSDLITELDMLGILSTKVVSKGRYGRTREITLTITNNVLENLEKQLSMVL